MARQAIEVITAFIRSQLVQTGFERLVVGLSGGVDSATTAFLAARAIPADDILAVRMPYRTSAPDSEGDALRVVEALGGLPLSKLHAGVLAADALQHALADYRRRMEDARSEKRDAGG